MKDIGVVKIHCFSEAISPITHMMETAGNEAIINKEYVYHNGITKMIPVISGNSIRHRLIREPGSMYLVNAFGLNGKLSIDQANYMFYGGSLTESTTSENMRNLADLKKLFPLYRLIGGSLRNQIIAGSLIVKRGVLVCEENRNVLSQQLPEGFELPEEILKSCEDFIKQYQYTRGDIQKSKEATEILKETEGDIDTNLMIYNGQSIIPGAIFYHGFIADNVSRLEIGALIHSIQMWENSGSTIGGSSRIGHGKIKLNIYVEDSEGFITIKDIPDCIKEYIEHVGNNIIACIEWLNNNFPGKVKKSG